MRAAGLKAISTVLESTAVLIKNKNPSNQQLIDLITSRIRGVISMFFETCFRFVVCLLTLFIPAAQKYVLCTYNISRPSLNAATAAVPGKRAATITQLELEGWVAVQVMVAASKIADTMDELEKFGAEDILVMKLENTRTKVGKDGAFYIG